MNVRKPGMPFLALGAAFVALGISGQEPFLYIGLAFLAIAAGALWRERRKVDKPG